MLETPVSLLERLRATSDPALWQQLVSIYDPLLRRWLRQLHVAAQDADELCQEIFMVVMRELPHFSRGQQRGAFRCWLRTIAVHRVLAFRRSEASRPIPVGEEQWLEMVAQLQDPDTELSRLWDDQHDRHVLRALLDTVRGDFEDRTWQAFERLVEGERAAAIASDLGMTAAAVYAAKSRVLRRLREQARGLVD